jgi:hypothetical protein
VKNTSTRECFVVRKETKKEPKKPKQKKPEPEPQKKAEETGEKTKNTTMVPVEETSGNIVNGNDLSQTKKLVPKKNGKIYVKVVQ